MERHLIALDLDGTLLDNNQQISEFTKETLRKVQDLGHLVVIATGRPYHASIDYFYEVGMTGPLITDNGGNIREPLNPDFQIVIDGIPTWVSHQIFVYSKPYLESAFYSYGDHVYSYKYLDRLHSIFMGSQKAKIVHCDFLEFNHTPTGMIYLIDKSFKQSFENHLINDFGDYVNFRLWGEDTKHGIYEIYKRGSSKLSGIRWVQRHNQIKDENVMAFGDGLNDIEMLQGVAQGYAMPNGELEAKHAAKAVIEFTNQEDGVAKFLKNYFKI